MACHEDELEYNPFYQKLTTKYPAAFAEATKKCYMICVPEASSMKDVEVNNVFIENHILRPSPFFKGQYLTTDNGNNRVVHLDAKVIKTGSGFSQSQTINILLEELSYNKNLQPYKLLVIASPIGIATGSDKKAASSNTSTKASDQSVDSVDDEDAEHFLLSLKGHAGVISNLDEALHQFNTNYMVLKEYLGDTAVKLRSIFHQYSQNLLRVVDHPMKNDPRFENSVENALESYILPRVHSKLMPVIHEKYSLQDRDVVKKCQSLRHYKACHVGVKDMFSCDLPLAVEELQKIDSLHMPVEKMNCIKSTLDLVTSGVYNHIQSTSIPGMCSDLPPLTSDDLIPLMVYVIIQAQCGHLSSTLYYLNNFHWSGAVSGDTSFSYVTFQAAMEYLTNTNFAKISPAKKTGPKRQTQQQDSLKKTDGPPVSPTLTTGPARSSRTDRQLDRITKMLEMSTKDFTSVSESVPVSQGRPNRPQANNNALGDFLGSLQNDVLPSNYGKLS